MIERWRSLRPAWQDAVFAVVFASLWFGAYLYLRDHGWLPTNPDTYELAGAWTTGVLLLRRTAPGPVLVATTLVYPLAYQAPLQSEFHLLPILVAGYSATSAGWLRSIGALVLSIGAVFVMSTGGLYGYHIVEWDRVLVNEFATACAVLLGAVMHDQRRTAATLAERNVELEQLRRVEAAQAIVDERTRIARELHDVVAHHLTALIVRAQATDRVAKTRSDDNGETLRWIVDTARDALTATRQTVRVLRSDGNDGPELAPGPSLADLPGMAERMQAAGLDVSLQVTTNLPPLDQQTELAAVRITQEALTNTLRHAHARRAVVSLHVSGDGVVLGIDDDGNGDRAPAGSLRGHGLVGMRERATSCGGSLHLGPSPLGGWQVRAWLPVVPTSVTTG